MQSFSSVWINELKFQILNVLFVQLKGKSLYAPTVYFEWKKQFIYNFFFFLIQEDKKWNVCTFCNKTTIQIILSPFLHHSFIFRKRLILVRLAMDPAHLGMKSDHRATQKMCKSKWCRVYMTFRMGNTHWYLDFFCY